MKSLIISCVILVLLLGTLLFYGIYSNSVLDKLIDFCNSDSIYSLSDVKAAQDYWTKHEWLIHLGVNFSLNDNVSLGFAEHCAALEANDYEEIKKTAETLRFHIERIKDGALVSWESVF